MSPARALTAKGAAVPIWYVLRLASVAMIATPWKVMMGSVLSRMSTQCPSPMNVAGSVLLPHHWTLVPA
jgi:hypothetical protein